MLIWGKRTILIGFSIISWCVSLQLLDWLLNRPGIRFWLKAKSKATGWMRAYRFEPGIAGTDPYFNINKETIPVQPSEKWTWCTKRFRTHWGKHPNSKIHPTFAMLSPCNDLDEALQPEITRFSQPDLYDIALLTHLGTVGMIEQWGGRDCAIWLSNYRDESSWNWYYSWSCEAMLWPSL